MKKLTRMMTRKVNRTPGRSSQEYLSIELDLAEHFVRDLLPLKRDRMIALLLQNVVPHALQIMRLAVIDVPFIHQAVQAGIHVLDVFPEIPLGLLEGVVLEQGLLIRPREP